MLVDDAQALGAATASFGAQMLAPAHGRALALDDDRAEHSVQSFAVIDVGRGHDERKRDATTVHQKVSLAALLFSDPAGWTRRLPAPAGPSSVRRPSFAIVRRCPPCRRTRPVRPSTAIRRSRPSPIRECACGPRWRSRSVRRAVPSTDTRRAARTRCLRRPAAPAWASACAGSMICVESVSTVPSSPTRVGSRTTGLMRSNCAFPRKIQTWSGAKRRPSRCSGIVVRRTNGESRARMS